MSPSDAVLAALVVGVPDADVSLLERVVAGRPDPVRALFTRPGGTGRFSDPLPLLEQLDPADRLGWVCAYSAPDDDLESLLGDRLRAADSNMAMFLEDVAKGTRTAPPHLLEYLVAAAGVPACHRLHRTAEGPGRDRLRHLVTERLIEHIAARRERVTVDTYDEALDLLAAGAKGDARVFALGKIADTIRTEDPNIWKDDAELERVAHSLADLLIDGDGTSIRDTAVGWLTRILELPSERPVVETVTARFRLAGLTCPVEADDVAWPGGASRTVEELWTMAHSADPAAHAELVDGLLALDPTQRFGIFIAETLTTNPAVAEDLLLRIVGSPWGQLVTRAAEAAAGRIAERSAEFRAEIIHADGAISDELFAASADRVELAALLHAKLGTATYPIPIMYTLERHGLLDPQVTASLPVCVVVDVAEDPQLGPPLFGWIGAELGDDVRRWNLFAELGAEFTGTVGDLLAVLDTARA